MSNNFLYHHAQRIFNSPLAIHPHKAEIIVSALSDRLGGARLFQEDGVNIFTSTVASDIHDDDEDRKGYGVRNGVAIIPVTGTLVHKHGYIRPTSGMTGYDSIRHNLHLAMEDPNVSAIAFDIDSPGGEVAGVFDLTDTIYELRGEKPMTAILSEYAFSAAYAIASACDLITVPRTGGTGSIGVVAIHVDYSQAMEDAGVKVTLIQYGKRKTDGMETKPLSSSARERLQKDVDTMGEMFVETVARNRGLAVSKVRDMEAATFMGEAGIANGLADGICAPQEAFSRLCDAVA